MLLPNPLPPIHSQIWHHLTRSLKNLNPNFIGLQVHSDSAQRFKSIYVIELSAPIFELSISNTAIGAILF